MTGLMSVVFTEFVDQKASLLAGLFTRLSTIKYH